MKKRLTPNQKKLREEMDRIFEITDKFESENLIVDYSDFKIQKRISKKYLDWLHNQNVDTLLDRTLYNYNGELIPGKNIFSVDDFIDTDIPNFSDIVIQNVRKLIADFPTRGAKMLENLLNTQIENLGYEHVATALENNSEETIENCYIIVYSSGQEVEEINRAVYNLLTIIQGHKPNVLDMIMLEEYEEI